MLERLSIDEINAMRVAELKQLLQPLKLKRSGKKEELIQRLVDFKEGLNPEGVTYVRGAAEPGGSGYMLD